MAEERMLNDEILLGLIKANSGGGGGGTTDYSDLSNKPQINNVTLSGNKSASDLGLVASVDGKGLSTNDYTDADKAIVGGVTAALASKQDALTAGDYIEIDGNEISVNPVVPNENVTYEFKTKDASGGDATVTLIKKSGDTVISSTDYRYESVMGNKYITVDDLFYFGYSTTFTSRNNWGYKLLAASADHAVDYTRTWEYSDTVDYTENYTSIDHSGENLVLKAQMDTALAAKQDTLTFDDTPTDNSNNPVKSNGVYDALALKQDKTDNSLQTTSKTVVGAVNELKSGLTNVRSDVKLNTQDLTTPSRSINLMTLPITITKSGSSTGTVTNNDGVITLNGEFLNEEVITVTCADCIAPNDAIIAYMNNVALTKANISFYNGSTKHDYFSFAIPNRIIYTSALANVVGKTINRYDITFTETTTLDNFTFSLMMAHNGQDVSTYAPYIPSIESRIEAVESGLTNKVGIATATDLNDEKSIGVRTFAYNTPNNPSNHSGSMLGLFQSESYGMQLAQSSSETEAYIRFFNTNTWSSWDKIVTDSDLSVSNGTITPQEDVTITNYILQKSNKTVYLYMLVKFTPTLGTAKLICVLPSGYRAQARLLFSGYNGTLGKFVTCETDSYGVVRVFPTSDDSTAVLTDYFLTITYFTS